MPSPETADSADFTDFEGVIGDVRTNLFVAKLQGIDNRNLFYPCNLRNLWLNPFSVFGLKTDRRFIYFRTGSWTDGQLPSKSFR